MPSESFESTFRHGQSDKKQRRKMTSSPEGPSPLRSEVEAEEEKPMVKLMSFIHTNTLILENKGSVARDHLANERTFLAWARTSMVMMTMGLAFLQLYSLQKRAKRAVLESKSFDLLSQRVSHPLSHLGKPFGIMVGVFSLLLACIGLYRYLAVQTRLREDEFPATRVLALLSLSMCFVSMLLVWIMSIKAL